MTANAQLAAEPHKREQEAGPAPDFIAGELTKLRPVLEGDLEGLARLLAQNPRGFGWEQEPWTLQRLKKMFEAEKTQGLWSRTIRFFTVTDLSGKLLGVLREETERGGKVDLDLQADEQLENWASLYADALGAWLAYRQSWFVTPRIDCALLGPQKIERRLLEDAGFELQLSAKEAYMHLGELVSLDILAWIPQWVMDNRAPDGIGE